MAKQLSQVTKAQVLGDGICPQWLREEMAKQRQTNLISQTSVFGDSDSARVFHFVQELPRATRHLEIGSSL